jgi:hypothetical protein
MAFARLSSLLLLMLCTAVQAQAPARVRGTVESFDGTTLVVKGAEPIRVGEKTEIVFTQPIALADIKQGDFLGVTSRQAADGTLTAYEVRRFPKPLNPGHRPFDGGANQTMTNATVGAVLQAPSGRDLVLVYDGGKQQIKVMPDAAVSELVPGNKSQLVPGAAVNLTHNAGVAMRIQVSPRK